MGDSDMVAFVLRKTTVADLDAIAKIVQDGFPDNLEFDYEFPYRDKYPADNSKWIRKEFEEYIGQPEKYAVLVAVPVPVGPHAQGDAQPIAVGVWDIAVETKSTGGDGGINDRRDANPAHMKEYARALSTGFQKFFAHYGKEQIHLWTLVTHPGFRRRGVGTMLCNWGIEEATKKGWISTVLASSMGKSLYESLGYKLVGTERVQAEGEDGTFDLYCLEQKTKNFSQVSPCG